MITESTISVAEKVNALMSSQTYPFNAGKIEFRETHMSWVFLTGTYVYKMKKPVKNDVLNFSTIDARFRNCYAEVRLNRRLAREVYTSVVPLSLVNGNIQVEGDGEKIDWLVKMKQLPENLMLDELIRNRTIDRYELEKAALLLADLYRNEEPASISFETYRSWLEKDIRFDLAELLNPRYSLSKEAILEITSNLRGFIDNNSDVIEERVVTGKIIEGHGDLRPEHICLVEKPMIIDCLEFNRRLRTVDMCDDLSLLAMECENLGVDNIAPIFFNTNYQINHDAPPAILISFYKCRRALTRARLSISHLKEHRHRDNPKWRKKAKKYLNLAARYGNEL